MITFNYNTQFQLSEENIIKEWIERAIYTEEFTLGEINYIFCNDEELLKLNQEYLNHDTYTDIISFDYSVGKELHGDIFISVERVRENAKLYEQHFFNELYRVIIHGILHFCGYNDKAEAEQILMRSKEDFYLNELN